MKTLWGRANRGDREGRERREKKYLVQLNKGKMGLWPHNLK